MKVIIDTNVVISAALKDRDPELVVLFVAQHPAFEWVASQEIVTEYVNVLQRPKFRLPDTIVQQWQAMFATLITIGTVDVAVTFPRDQNDAKFIACAIAMGADYLITGDRDFTEAYQVATTTIISVALFKEQVCAGWNPDT